MRTNREKQVSGLRGGTATGDDTAFLLLPLFYRRVGPPAQSRLRCLGNTSWNQRGAMSPLRVGSEDQTQRATSSLHRRGVERDQAGRGETSLAKAQGCFAGMLMPPNQGKE